MLTPTPTSHCADPSNSIYGANGNPRAYPGAALSEPVLMIGNSLFRLDYRPGGGPLELDLTTGQSLNEYLLSRGLAPLNERTPSIAYGANRDPVNLLYKLQKFGASVTQDVVMLPLTITNADILVAGKSPLGYYYGGLAVDNPGAGAVRPYLDGSEVPATLLLLTQAQMECIHRSEEVAAPSEPNPGCYQVGILNVRLGSGDRIAAQVYLGNEGFLSSDGEKPIALAAVQTQNRDSRIPALTQDELFERNPQRLWLSESGVQESGLSGISVLSCEQAWAGYPKLGQALKLGADKTISLETSALPLINREAPLGRELTGYRADLDEKLVRQVFTDPDTVHAACPIYLEQFSPQLSDWSCGAACFEMLLGSVGIQLAADRAESHIRAVYHTGANPDVGADFDLITLGLFNFAAAHPEYRLRVKSGQNLGKITDFKAPVAFDIQSRGKKGEAPYHRFVAKTEGEDGHQLTQDELLEAIRNAAEEFKESNPEVYNRMLNAALNDGVNFNGAPMDAQYNPLANCLRSMKRALQADYSVVVNLRETTSCGHFAFVQAIGPNHIVLADPWFGRLSVMSLNEFAPIAGFDDKIGAWLGLKRYSDKE